MPIDISSTRLLGSALKAWSLSERSCTGEIGEILGLGLGLGLE